MAQVYAGVSGGVSLPSDSKNQGRITGDIAATPDFSAIPSGTSLGWRSELDSGYAISGQLGYRFDNGLRLEGEVSYSDTGVRRHRDLSVGGTVIDGIDVAVLTRGAPSASNPTVGQVLSTDDGKITNLGAFGNVLYDFKTGSAIRPYLGAGLGIQRTKVDYNPSNVRVVDDSQTRLAYQLMAGASASLGRGVEIFGQYGWRANFGRADTRVDLVPASLGVQSRQSLLTLGVRVGL
jgi:opacity protein-like surface antigen